MNETKSFLSWCILSRGKESSFFLSTIYSMCITRLLLGYQNSILSMVYNDIDMSLMLYEGYSLPAALLQAVD